MFKRTTEELYPLNTIATQTTENKENDMTTLAQTHTHTPREKKSLPKEPSSRRIVSALAAASRSSILEKPSRFLSAWMIIQFNFLKYVYFLYDGGSDALIVVLSLSVSVTSLLFHQSVFLCVCTRTFWNNRRKTALRFLVSLIPLPPPPHTHANPT